MVSSYVLIAIVLWLTAKERQGDSAELSALQTASNVAAMLLFIDQSEADRELKLLSSRRDLIAATIFDAQGRTFASYAKPIVPLDKQSREVIRQYQQLEILLQIPIYEKNEFVGFLVVSEKLHKLRNWFLQGLALMSAIMAVLYFFSVRVLIKIQQKALNPLVQLTELAEQVATDRDFSIRAKVHQLDEIGRLGQRINELLKRIEIWQDEMSNELENAHC